jgi:hypothetical protein
VPGPALWPARRLTRYSGGRKMVEFMSGMLRSRRRIPAVAVAAALCTMLFATCLTATALPAKAKACCTAMQHDCGGASMESSCCTVSSTVTHAVMPAKPADQPVPFGVPTAILLTVWPAPLPSRSPGSGSVSSSPPGVPTYLFISSFRI